MGVAVEVEQREVELLFEEVHIAGTPVPTMANVPSPVTADVVIPAAATPPAPPMPPSRRPEPLPFVEAAPRRQAPAPEAARPPASPTPARPDLVSSIGAGSMAGDRQEAADVVVTALADGRPQVRREAIRALRRIGGPMAGRALADTLAQDPSPEVREEAVAALAALLAPRMRGGESGG